MVVEKRNWLLIVLKYLFLLFVSVIVIFPLIWLIVTAFKTKAEIFSEPYRIIPRSFRLTNFTTAWSWAPFGAYYVNTFITSLGLLVIQLFIVTMAAYSFARINFPGRDLLFTLFLTQLMISAQSTIFPNYLMIANLHLVDTKTGIMLPYFASANGTFLLRQAFKSINQSLEDAAKLDGCNTFQLLWFVFLPQVTPTLLTFSIISVTYHWNEFLWPLLVSETTRSRTLTVGLTVFAQQAEGGAEWGLLMAATIFVIAPVLLAFTFFQKKFIQSYASSGVKG
jgi:sn-glycerol 3-phosphate transport system permease protein